MFYKDKIYVNDEYYRLYLYRKYLFSFFLFFVIPFIAFPFLTGGCIYSDIEKFICLLVFAFLLSLMFCCFYLPDIVKEDFDNFKNYIEVYKFKKREYKNNYHYKTKYKNYKTNKNITKINKKHMPKFIKILFGLIFVKILWDFAEIIPDIIKKLFNI